MPVTTCGSQRKRKVPVRASFTFQVCVPVYVSGVVAPGYNRRTVPLTYTGTQIWKVKLARAGTFRFLCDPHVATGMKGSAKILRSP